MNRKDFLCSTLLAVGLAAVLSLPARVAAQPAVGGQFARPPEKLEEQSLIRLEEQKKAYGALTDAGTFPIGDLLHCWFEDGQLKARITPKDLPGNGTRVRAKIPGLVDPLAASAQWTLQSFAFGGPPPNRVRTPGNSMLLTRYDFSQDKPGQLWQMEFRVEADEIMINASGIADIVSFHENPKEARLTTITPRGPTPVLTIAAPTLRELMRQHPLQVRQFLPMILLRMTGHDLLEPGPADVYSVFTDISADPATAKAVADLLGQMNSDSPDKRDTASAELGKLGTPGILAVLRLDRSKLSQEQKTRCDQFVAAGRMRDFDDPADALRDASFLLEAMNNADVRVREAARKAMEKLRGHPLDIDVSQQSDVPARLAALEKIRSDYQAMQAPKSPATQPATRSAAQPAGGI